MLEFVRKQTPEFEAQWESLYDMDEDTAALWAAVLLAHATMLRRALPTDALAAATASGRIDPLLQQLPWLTADDAAMLRYADLLEDVHNRGANAELGRLGIPLQFAPENPYATRWAGRRSAALVTQVSEETRAAIRAALQEAFDSGLTSRRMAMQIRTLVGLTERDAKAALTYWQTLSRESGLPPKRVDELANTYAQRLLQRRAQTIAETEIVAAANAGAQAAWADAEAKGHIAPGSEQEWVAVKERNTCPRCLALDGQRVPLGAPFETAQGFIFRPPRHPRCRCALRLHRRG